MDIEQKETPYWVTYKVRNRGAIGVFREMTVCVDAITQEEAKNKAFLLLQSQNLETNECTRVAASRK